MIMKTFAMACAVSALLAGCTTDIKHVSYRSTGGQQPVPPALRSLAVGNFTDNRGVDARLLCVVKNAYGAILKRVETDKPVSDIVRDAFAAALEARGMKPVADAPYEIEGSFDLLGCSYTGGKLFTADITVSVVALPGRQVVFQQKYSTHRTEGGMGAGILADVDPLTQSEQETINQTIDKVLSDPNFLSAAAGNMPTPGAAAPATSAFSINERLKKLDDLRAQGLLTEQEYTAKRQELINSL